MTKRKGNGEGFVRFPNAVIDSEAFLNLSTNATKLLLLICRQFNGRNNGGLRVSIADAQRQLHCARRTAIRAFKDLEHAGFITKMERGGFRYRGSARVGVSTAWSVSFLPEGGADVVKL